MNSHTNPRRKETQAMAYTDDDEAIKIVIGMLSPAVAAETASFTFDSSLQLYPEAMRGRPDTPPATSLREYHFSVLMAQVARAYAEGRGQDFADGRSAIDNLLREEPGHQHLAERFRTLMGLWLQEAHDKLQQEELERRQREDEDEDEEMEDSEDSEQGEGKEAGKESKTGNASVASQESPSSSSTASADSQGASRDGSEVDGSPAAARAKSVFDLSGQITTDDSSDDDEDSSSDEEGITHK